MIRSSVLCQPVGLSHLRLTHRPTIGCLFLPAFEANKPPRQPIDGFRRVNHGTAVLLYAVFRAQGSAKAFRAPRAPGSTPSPVHDGSCTHELLPEVSGNAVSHLHIKATPLSGGWVPQPFLGGCGFECFSAETFRRAFHDQKSGPSARAGRDRSCVQSLRGTGEGATRLRLAVAAAAQTAMRLCAPFTFDRYPRGGRHLVLQRRPNRPPLTRDGCSASALSGLGPSR